jgi:hypothetical protein
MRNVLTRRLAGYFSRRVSRPIIQSTQLHYLRTYSLAMIIIRTAVCLRACRRHDVSCSGHDVTSYIPEERAVSLLQDLSILQQSKYGHQLLDDFGYGTVIRIHRSRMVYVQVLYPGGLRLEGRVIAQAATRRLPTAEAHVRGQVWSCGICG